MVLGGDEKRIQALFSELSSEDQNLMPVFEKLWRRAETTESTGVRSVRRSALVIASAFLVIAAAGYFVARTRYWPAQAPTQNTVQLAPQKISIPEPRELPDKLASTGRAASSRSTHQKRPARRRQTERRAVDQAVLLSSWRSPTERLMELPTDLALQSLPQLTQSVNELKLFLLKNNEAMKESNQ